MSPGFFCWMSGMATGLLVATLSDAVAFGWLQTAGTWLCAGVFFGVGVGALAMALRGAFEDGTRQWRNTRLRLVRRDGR